MNILLLEDDKKTGSFIARGLAELGHVVDWSEDGRSIAEARMKDRRIATISASATCTSTCATGGSAGPAGGSTSPRRNIGRWNSWCAVPARP